MGKIKNKTNYKTDRLMSPTKQKIKIIRLGGKIITFNEKGLQKVVLKEQSPELFNTISDLINQDNDTEVYNILYKLESNIKKTSQGNIYVKNGKAFYKKVELPEFASKAIISMVAKGINDFTPITLFYEKLRLNTDNEERINEILNSILLEEKDTLKFTSRGNIIVKSIPFEEHKYSFVGNSTNSYQAIYIHNKNLEAWAEKEWVLISPLDIIRISNEAMYFSQNGMVSTKKPDIEEIKKTKDYYVGLIHERPVASTFKRIILKQAKRLVNNFEISNNDTFVNIPMEELYDMKFEMLKELQPKD